MQQPPNYSLNSRLKASVIHFGISFAIALVAALLVFSVWYPYPYRDISGGRELFFILVVVDVVLGPLITLVVYNLAKPRKELVRDLAMVALIQFCALGYGMWTVSVARPVHLVFEYRYFRVVHAVDVPIELLGVAPPGINSLPVKGPTLLSLREFSNDKEKMDATMAALQGIPLAARPDLWQPYAAAVPEILKAARPVALLKDRFSAQAAEIDAAIARTGRKTESVVFVPMVARKALWTVLLDAKSAEVLGYMPLDSF